LFKGKFRAESIRLSYWDYRLDGYYHVVICVKDICDWFGDIEEMGMRLSTIGKVVLKCWKEIPKHFPDVILDDFAIMPNHLHGIVVINRSGNIWDDGKDYNPEGDRVLFENNNGQTRKPSVETRPPAGEAGHGVHNHNGKFHNPSVETRHVASLQSGLRKFGPLQPYSLSSIIHAFKSSVKRWCNQNDYRNFRWQERFWDTIIENEKQLMETRRYIRDNPRKKYLEIIGQLY